MEQIYGRLLIFDGSHALHRNLSEPHLWEMKNTNGQRTGGVYGTLQTILKESSTYNYFPVVVFDGSLSKRRLDIHPNYKRYLEKKALYESKENLTEAQLFELEYRREYNTQREILKQLLPAFGIPTIHLDNWEGDDIIYILTKLSKDSIVVSDDKDLLQLICEDEDRRCRVRRGMRDEFWDINTLKEKNMDTREFIACKAICGDESDNIPSACLQVGEKTAPGLYKLYQCTLGTEFPKDEKQLVESCKKYNISKRTAYLNFNENQFLNNLLLMDLSLVDQDVENDSQVLYSISNVINKQYNNTDTNTIIKLLNDLNIKSFIINNLLDNVQRTLNYIDLDFDFTQIPDIVKPKMGRLF